MEKKSAGLHVSELVEMSYAIAKEEFKDKFFNFQSIGSMVGRKAQSMGKEKVEDGIGHFYTAVSTDPRFVVFSFDSWRLKEFMTMSELKKLENTVFSDTYIFEEEQEVFRKLAKEKKEMEMLPDASPDEAISSTDDDSDEDRGGDSEEEDIFEEEE